MKLPGIEPAAIAAGCIETVALTAMITEDGCLSRDSPGRRFSRRPFPSFLQDA